MNPKKKVLIIEDDKAVAELIAEFCAILGFETRIRNEGVNILNTIRFFRPDLITLDLILPDISGVDLLSIIRSDPEARNIPVVVISAIATHGDVYKQIDQCSGVMNKPIRMSAFRNALQTAMATAA